MQARQVTILDGSTFVVSDVQGDIDAQPDQPLGFFYRDMRHLSTWRVLLNGRPLDALSTAEFGYDEAVFFLTLPTGTIYQNPHLSVIRRRFVGDGLREELTVNNGGMDDLVLELTVLFGADFADIFEVKDHQAKAGQICQRVQGTTAVLRYRRADFLRETRIAADGAFFTEASLSYRLNLAAGQSWRGLVEVSVSDESHQTLPKRR